MLGLDWTAWSDGTCCRWKVCGGARDIDTNRQRCNLTHMLSLFLNQYGLTAWLPVSGPLAAGLLAWVSDARVFLSGATVPYDTCAGHVSLQLFQHLQIRGKAP